MSAHLSRLRLFQRHLRSLVWVWVWVWDWIHSHTPPRTRSPSSRHPPFTHYPFPLRSLVCGGQPSPHKPRLVVSHSTCPPLSSSPHAHSFVLGTAVINTHTVCVPLSCVQCSRDGNTFVVLRMGLLRLFHGKADIVDLVLQHYFGAIGWSEMFVPEGPQQELPVLC
jgi:hypothetical protein